MNINIQVDTQEEFQQLLEALRDLPFMDKVKLTVATPEDFIPRAVKSRVLNVLPGAELLLFGSRARGDASKHSDWDFLVLTDQPATKAERRQVMDSVMELELARGCEIQVVYRTRAAYAREGEVAGLVGNVVREGIVV